MSESNGKRKYVHKNIELVQQYGNMPRAKAEPTKKKSSGSRKLSKPFTEMEDQMIIEAMNGNVPNLTFACKKLEEKMDRSYGSIYQRWYILRDNVKYAGTLTVGSSKGFTNNKKNIHVDKKTGEMPPVELKNLLWLIEFIMKLPKKEFEAIMTILNYKY